MPVQGRSWRNYSALVTRVAHWADPTRREKFIVDIEPKAEEDTWLKRFARAVRQEEPEALALLEDLGISTGQFRFHLRYVATWSKTRRQLLAHNGNFQLLEGLNKHDEQGRLEGLVLSGSRAAQERALHEHLQQFVATPEGQGWLAPVPNPGKSVREYGNHEVVWLYSTGELQRADDLHPSVARSLIRRYLPKPGVVADPMAGSGTIARMATLMGHRAWASDLTPREPFIAQHDIFLNPLEARFEEADVAADLVFVHPPTPEEMKMSDHAYAKWLGGVLQHCWEVVAQQGHVVLVVPLSGRMAVLASGEWALIQSANEAFENDGLEEEVRGLTAQHLAASRDGRQGWQLLVMQRPELEADKATPEEKE